MDKVVPIAIGRVDHPDAIKDSKAVDLTREVTDKEATGADLWVTNKVMVNKDKEDMVERLVTKVVMVVKAMAVQLDNRVVIVWAMTTRKKVADNLLMVVEDGVVIRDSLKASNQAVRANHNPVHHLKKEKAARKIREIKTRTGIAKA